MQRKVTMALAMFWLVFVAIVGTNSSQPPHLTFDQYSPPKPPSQQRVNYTDNVSSHATHRKDTTAKDRSIDPTNILKLIFANRASKEQQLETVSDSFKYEDETSNGNIHSSHASNKNKLKLETVEEEEENNFIEDSGNLDHIQHGSLKVSNNEIRTHSKQNDHGSFTVNDHYSHENPFPPWTNKEESIDRSVETWKEELFNPGTVPELQVGCEGAVESSSRKKKRSPTIGNNWLYDFHSKTDEDVDEEYIVFDEDEPKRRDQDKRRRSDIEVPAYYDDYDDDEENWIWDDLPTRGDLGMNGEGWDLRRKILDRRNQTHDNAVESESEVGNEGPIQIERLKRSTQWGFDEDEGNIRSNEDRNPQNHHRWYENSRGIDGYRIINDYQRQTRTRRPEENIKQRATKGSYDRSVNEHLYRQRAEQEFRKREEGRKQRPEEDSEDLAKRRQEWLMKKQRLNDARQETLRNDRGRESHDSRQTRPTVHRHRDDSQNARTNEEENRRKLEEYIRRNQPIRVPNRSNQPSNAEPMSNARDERRRHQPSTPTNYNRSPSNEENRRRQAERQREEETREYQNRRRQEEMRRLEEQNRRTQTVRPAQPNPWRQRDTNSPRIHDEATRRPGNWNNHNREAMAQRRGEPDVVYAGPTQVDRRSDDRNEERRREEDIRLNSLPVEARIILLRSNGSSTRPVNGTQPVVVPRTGFGDEIDFPNLDPHRRGIEVARFPAPATLRPPARSPTSCNFAILQCCSWKNPRLVRCFESLNCPGVNWDSNPCSKAKVEAAKAEVGNFFHSNRNDDE